MRRILGIICVVGLAVPGAFAKPRDDAGAGEQEGERTGRYQGTGGANQINSGLRSDTEADWARARNISTISQLTGPVVQRKARTLYVQGEDLAVIPFDTSELRFVRHAPLREGTVVRVSFAQEGTRNVATGVERLVVSPAQGAAGSPSPSR